MLKELNNIEKAILETIIYYDLFDYPLTANEIWKGLFKYKTDLFSVVNCLEKGKDLKKYIETRNGFYFLKTRKEILNIRKKRRDYSIKKWKKALKAVRIIRFIPFVRAVFLCNSIPYFNAEEDSDIDFFIIIKDKYIWFSRFWITILLHILKMRRHGKKIKDRICLSFYISTSNLDLKNLTYERDIHFYYWLADFVLIFDRNYANNFYQANQWLKEFLPQFSPSKIVDNWIIKENKLSIFVSGTKELFFDNCLGKFFNLVFKKIQLFKIYHNKNSRLKENNTDVIVKDNILKFHEKDSRKEIRDLFYKKISSY